jgi:SAM-dependent methyltransferase
VGSDWDEYAGEWDSDEEVVLYSERAFVSLREQVALDGLHVLDFGCGTGRLTQHLAKHAKRVVGLDTSPAMLAVLERKALPNVLTVGDELTSDLAATHPGFRDEFDVITASSVCGFLAEYDSTLRLLKSLLAPDGVFVQWDWLSPGPASDHGLTEQEVLGALRQTGFKSVSVSTPFSMSGPRGTMDVLMGLGRNA